MRVSKQGQDAACISLRSVRPLAQECWRVTIMYTHYPSQDVSQRLSPSSPSPISLRSFQTPSCPTHPMLLSHAGLHHPPYPSQSCPASCLGMAPHSTLIAPHALSMACQLAESFPLPTTQLSPHYTGCNICLHRPRHIFRVAAGCRPRASTFTGGELRMRERDALLVEQLRACRGGGWPSHWFRHSLRFSSPLLARLHRPTALSPLELDAGEAT